MLTLAEAELFQLRWSKRILDETEKAIEGMLANKGVEDARARAARARSAMERAFEDAMTTNFDTWLRVCGDLPDGGDAHVVAAALKARSAVIVTENIKDFPAAVLSPLNLAGKTAGVFVADTLALEPHAGVAAIRRMRERLKRPDVSAERLLIEMRVAGLAETANLLEPHVHSL